MSVSQVPSSSVIKPRYLNQRFIVKFPVFISVNAEVSTAQMGTLHSTLHKWEFVYHQKYNVSRLTWALKYVKGVKDGERR